MSSRTPTVSGASGYDKYFFRYPIYDIAPTDELINLGDINLTVPPQGGYWSHAGDSIVATSVLAGVTNAIRTAGVDWVFPNSNHRQYTTQFDEAGSVFPKLKPSLQDYEDAHNSKADTVWPKLLEEASKKWEADGMLSRNLSRQERDDLWYEHLYPYTEVCKQVCDAHPEVKEKKDIARPHWDAFTKIPGEPGIETAQAPEELNIENAAAMNSLLREMDE